ncbi:MAG: hypothetical protein AAGF89_01500 [Bacteroidota bacterium]
MKPSCSLVSSYLLLFPPSSVSGIVLDEQKQGLAFASISLYQLPDTTFL